MDTMNYQHRDLASGRWAEMSFASQMGNIGSEVSRAIRWKKKNNKERMNSCVERALELIDLSIDAYAMKDKQSSAKLKEILRCREELCNYFFDEKDYICEEEKMMHYFDSFAVEAIVLKKDK